MKLKLLLFVLIIAQFAQAQSDKLPRQGNWGIYAVQISDSAKNALNLKQNAAEVKWIKPNATEASTGLKIGDILLEANGLTVKSSSDLLFTGFFNKLREGDKICFEVLRNNKKMKLCGKVQPKPYEKSEIAEVIYDKVKFKNGNLSAIITKPKNTSKSQKIPAIYFIPGYNCASYDNMIDFHPYKKMIDSLTNLGYAVYRCEKSGMGGSYNTPNCFDIDFHTEQAGFEAGYEKLLSYDFIDTSQIYIFGHSLGGINAPILAEKYQPKGVIVYGTTHLPWMEYLTQMLRFQNSMLGYSPVQVENDMEIYQSLLYDHYVLKMSPKKMIAKNPEYLPLLTRDFMYDGDKMIFQRHYSFMQQLNDLKLSEAWSKINAYVLSIYGEADFEALNPESHKEIAKIVNHYHPNHGTYQLLTETNHSFIKVGSMEDGLKATKNGTIGKLMRTNFNYEIVTKIDQWIKSLEK